MDKNMQFDLQEDQEPDNKVWVISLFASLILAGAVTGYLLSGKSESKMLSGKEGKIIKTEKVVGFLDEKTFSDSAEGILEKGGIDGEGTHHLKRKGGESQNVYLTSSVIDMDPYVGKKVKVWGETFSAQKAGWFMDVGKLELLE